MERAGVFMGVISPSADGLFHRRVDGALLRVPRNIEDPKGLPRAARTHRAVEGAQEPFMNPISQGNWVGELPRMTILARRIHVQTQPHDLPLHSSPFVKCVNDANR